MAIHELNFKNCAGLQIAIKDNKGNKLTKFHAFSKNGGKEATWRWVIWKHDAIMEGIENKINKRAIDKLINATQEEQ